MFKPITTKARQLRLEYQAKIGRTVPMQEVADETGISRKALNMIELNHTEAIDFDILARFCRFYSDKLGRHIGVGDVLEYHPEVNKRTPSLAGPLQPGY